MPDTPMAGEAGEYLGQRSVIEVSSSGVAWPAIIGGAFASVALAVLLFTLGTGFGLASVSPWARAGASVTTVTVVTGVWLIVLHWLASGLGGYLTGRLRTKWVGLHTHEVFFQPRPQQDPMVRTQAPALIWSIGCSGPISRARLA